MAYNAPTNISHQCESLSAFQRIYTAIRTLLSPQMGLGELEQSVILYTSTLVLYSSRLKKHNVCGIPCHMYVYISYIYSRLGSTLKYLSNMQNKYSKPNFSICPNSNYSILFPQNEKVDIRQLTLLLPQSLHFLQACESSHQGGKCFP